MARSAQIDPLPEVEALLSTDPPAALALLLKSWRQTFRPELGSLIERLGRKLQRPLEQLPIKRPERAERLAKLARHSSLADRSAVLAAFEAFTFDAPGATVLPAADAWLDVEPDPRIARMALRVLAQSRSQQLTAKVWRRMVGCLELHGDLGVVDESRSLKLLPHRRELIGWEFAEGRLRNVIEGIRKERPVRPLASTNTLARLRAALPDSGSSQAAAHDAAQRLLDEIISRPDDDGPRQVYADLLTERGDPQGEFILLQLARARRKVSPEARVREDELLAHYRQVFLGALEPHVKLSGLNFERGFIVKCQFRGTRIPAASAARLLEEADFSGAEVDPEARFDQLQIALNMAPGSFRAVARHAPRLRQLGLVTRPWMEVVPALMSESVTLSSLRFGVNGLRHDDVLAEVYESPIATQLKELEIRTEPVDPTHSSLVSAPFPALLKRAPPSLQRLYIELDRHFCLAFVRGERGWGHLEAERRDTGSYGDEVVGDALVRLLRTLNGAPLESARFTHAARQGALPSLLGRCGKFAQRVELIPHQAPR